MKVRLEGGSALLQYDPCLVKFPKDQIDWEDDTLRIVLEGYVLNSMRLPGADSGKCLRQIVKEQYLSGGFESVLTLLKGSYVLAIEDKAARQVYIGNDLLSKKPLFYLQAPGLLLTDSSFLGLVEAAKAADLPLTPDWVGAAEMINRCAFLGGDTYVKEIRFLEGLAYLRANGTEAEVCSMHCPGPEPAQGDALVEQIETLFSDACRMAVEKNRGAGWQQVFTLSAGMDSRCAFLKSLHHCDPDEVLCFSYGAEGCKELEIANRLAKRYGCELTTRSIDPVGFIADRDQVLEQNEGMMYYAGTTGLNRTLRSMDTSRFGLVITGLGGGEIMGDLCRPCTGEAEETALYEELFASLIPDEEQRRKRIAGIRQRYTGYNEYICMQDIRTCLNFAYTSRLWLETFSPFLYEDLFLLLLKVPQSRKAYRRLYAEWYLKHIGDPTPTSCFQGPVRITSRTAPDQLLKGVLRRIRRTLHLQSRWDMNPIALWVDRYEENRCFMADTLEKDLAILRPNMPEPAEKLQAAYVTADADSKLRILTLSGMLCKVLG